ncbi:diaminopimelate decarboxylase [Salibacter halophilus]|uniref:Diaminopimelate decarboxylase n=1 Tax=Salibacter halophilus TaxID=1803916 RepID=A0A6N6M5G0_9FLAO|nr:diaminopimelate decarboxylase [Salibacter halophilus]KAB1064849.1 diaminopimelate decarboxylase [Salibacter halophilus]
MTRNEQIKWFKEQETPFYFYDLEKLRMVLKALDHEMDQYGYHMHYALKANANFKVLTEMIDHGYGADCVSGGEVKRALEAGFDPQKVVFAGVGKSDSEIKYALENEIGCFNVESLEELEVIEELAKEMNKTANIALRLNPDVDAKTHHYITTGLNENKFGLNPNDLDSTLALLKKSKNLTFKGIHFHIGSQITELSAFKHLCLKANDFLQWFRDHKLKVEWVNVGGGLGIDYENPDEKLIPDFANFFRIFHQFLNLENGQSLHFELGRAIVAQMGEFITRVLYIKKGISRSFAIVDGGMSELIRPALYQAFHKIENLSQKGDPDHKYDVVGPICETSDTFGKQVSLPKTKRGDLISVRSSGAYGEVMASQYNLRGPLKILTSDDEMD